MRTGEGDAKQEWVGRQWSRVGWAHAHTTGRGRFGCHNKKDIIYQLYMVEKRKWRNSRCPEEGVGEILRVKYDFPLTYVAYIWIYS
jgi:hypothetical protein